MCIDPASAATITRVLAYSARTFPLDCEVYLSLSPEVVRGSHELGTPPGAGDALVHVPADDERAPVL